MTRREASNRRAIYISNSEESLLRIIRRLQRNTNNIVIDFLRTNIDTSDGNVRDTSANFRAINRLTSADRRELEPIRREMATYMLNRFEGQSRATTSYFSTFIDRTNRFERATNAATRKMLFRIGYDGEKFIEGGFLHNIVTNNSYVNDIKAELFKKMASNQALNKVIEDMSAYVRGTRQRGGLIESNYRTLAFDTFAQNDRILNEDIAVGLNLNHAVYSGGKIKTTRCFCRERNNRVYTREEIESWVNEDFQGKTIPYDPVIDLGGYNCRHQLDWISEELANQIGNINSYGTC